MKNKKFRIRSVRVVTKPTPFETTTTGEIVHVPPGATTTDHPLWEDLKLLFMTKNYWRRIIIVNLFGLALWILRTFAPMLAAPFSFLPMIYWLKIFPLINALAEPTAIILKHGTCLLGCIAVIMCIVILGALAVLVLLPLTGAPHIN